MTRKSLIVITVFYFLVLFSSQVVAMGLFSNQTSSDIQTEKRAEIWPNSNVFFEKEVNKLTDPPVPGAGQNCAVDEGGSVATDQLDGFRYVPKKKSSLLNMLTAPQKEDNELFENFAKLDGDPIALQQALCFYRKYPDTSFETKGEGKREVSLKNKRYITINDLNKNAEFSRMFVIDMETKKIKAYYSAHGIGGKKGVGKNGFKQSEYYSNESGSYATPRGMFLTGNTYTGKYGHSMRLHGLQKGINDNSYLRAIVMHGFRNMSPVVASSDDLNPKDNLNRKTSGFPALSKGCTMLEPRRAKEVINMIKSDDDGPGLYYNYTQEEKALGENYCADTNLMVHK